MQKEEILYKHLCKLDDGRVIPYDAASNRDMPDFYTPDKWEFIGTGVIYSINGVLQNSIKQLWFYVKR